MKYLLIAIFALVIAVVLGHFVSDDAGFVVIGYGGKVFRTSFVVFVALLVIALTALYIIWRVLYQVLTLKTRWLGWTGEYKRKRSQRALSNGLIALAEGNFNRAEQLLSRGADTEMAPAIHYLGAAEAAQAQHAEERRDTYLSLAQDAMPRAEVAIGIKRAEMQLGDDQIEQARASIDYLADRHPDNKQVLSLQQRVYSKAGDFAALMALLPALRRHKVYDVDKLADLEVTTATALLTPTFTSIDDLHAVWNRLPKSVREQPACIARYSVRLAQLGLHEEAEGLLRKKLNRQWDPELIEQYGNVHIQNTALQLERAETWLPTRENDADLLMCLAKLSVAADDWADASNYLERLITLEPTPLAYSLLADVHEHTGNSDLAHECREKGLRLATTGARGGMPALVRKDPVLLAG